MRFIQKVLLPVYSLLFGFILLLEIPVFILLWIVAQFFGQKTDQYRVGVAGLNKRVAKKLSEIFHTTRENDTIGVNSRQNISLKIDPRPQVLRSLPHEVSIEKNPFGRRNMVLYYEPEPAPTINRYLQKNYNAIRSRLDKKYIDFIYPSLLKGSNEEDLSQVLEYYFPHLAKETGSFQPIVQNLSSIHFYKELIGFNAPKFPCFIRSTDEKNENGYVYRIFYLPDHDQDIVSKSVEFYLSVVPPTPFPSAPQFSVGNRNFNSDDPDDRFALETNLLSQSLKAEMEKELLQNSTKGALRMLLFLFKQMKEYDVPGNLQVKKFIEQIQQSDITQLSPIVISATGKIILKDFGKQVELTPLQKTVFIFFLLKEDGIMFKNLPQYKNELMTIYSKVSNRSSMETIQNSINDLVNPYSNSMSEKCSRIKEAFIKCMDDRLARHYYVTGNRNDPKRIVLDRNLVIFEDSIY